MKFLLPIYLILFINFNLSAQKKVALDKVALIKKYPDESCIVSSEEIKYSFLVSTKYVGRVKHDELSIQENNSSKQITSKKYYTKKNVVFYDSYSDVSNMAYKAGLTKPSVINLIRGNYENDGIFHDDVKLCGYEIEMKKDILYDFYYSKTYSNPRFISKVYFNSSDPIEEKKIVFDIPQSVTLDLLEINFAGYKIEKEEKLDPIKKSKIITYTAKELQAFPEENSMPGVAKTFPHIIIVVKSFSTKNTSETYFSSKADIYKWCKQLADSVENNNKVFNDQLYKIIGYEMDSVKIMEKVFYWIQDHVRYIAFEDGIMGYKPQSADKVYNLLYGDCKGVANLCKQMLKSKGFDARLTWIGTNDIPYSNDLPFLGVYNHMICTVFLGGKRYYLDCTETFISINDYAERIQGRPVMIENGATYLDDKIPVADIKRNLIDVNTVLKINGNKIIGSAKITLNGEEKTNVLRTLNEIKTENQQKAIKNYLESNNPNLNITKFSNSNLSNRNEPLVINSEFEMNNSVYYENKTKEMILLPERDEEFKNFVIDTTRKSNYEFSNKYYLNSVTDINMPEGYSIKYLPQNVKESGDIYDIELNYKLEGNNLKLCKKIIIKGEIIKKTDFVKWNAMVAKMNTFYSEAVILKS